MTRPPVSVVLLNYNHGQFLGEALDALGAALGPDDELLAFDDASTDDSVNVYRSRAERLPQMRLILQERNKGVIACENAGLNLARHDYLYFAAADDRVDPPFFDRLLGLLAMHPQAGLGGCRTRLIDKAGNRVGMLKTPRILSEPGFLPRDAAARAFLAHDNWLIGTATIYRRQALVEAGGFLGELGSFADGFASRVVALRHGACYMPAVLSNWRKMEQGFASTETADQEKIREIGRRTVTLMQTRYADVFPAAYPERWYRRWVFGAAYYAWWRHQAARLGMSETGVRPRGLRRVLWAVPTLIVGAALYAYLRPRDIGDALIRHVRYLLRDEE